MTFLATGLGENAGAAGKEAAILESVRNESVLAMRFDEDLLTQIRQAGHVVAFTGAGVSAESGIPTFRDALTGMWSQFRPEELATPEAFMRDPATVWRWYEWRRRLMRSVGPNPAHHAIAKLEAHVERVTVITQNVDGLHAAAGSTNVIELHGNIWKNICFDCERRELPVAQGDVPPRCAYCGGKMRPAVVWFSEALPEQAWKNAVSALESADIFFCIGTSSLVEPAASLPRYAREGGSIVIQINPEPTSHDRIASYVLRGKAGQMMPALLSAAWPG